MATWRKYFTPVDVDNSPSRSIMSQSSNKPGPARKNYSSFLPDVYTGAPNRIERYMQYDTMDMDSEVNAALDIIAEFCSQKNRENQTPFSLYFKSKATNSEVSILREYLQQWCKLQKFETRIFRIVRNVFKYGDGFFVRDPETYKWMHIDPNKIVKIIVNESEGKEPEQYIIRDLNPNLADLSVAAIQPNRMDVNRRGTNFAGPGGSSAISMTGNYPSGASTGSRFDLQQTEFAIDAKHVVHLSLSEGLDNNFPFGNSLLENIFKVFKQKELLEDAILIYRIQRAPERRIFYIDVGSMPSHMAMSFVERVKNEIHQRRIPSSSGGGQNIIDSAFNPLSISEDYFFPTTAEGRGSKVETLPGGCFAMDTKVSLLDGRELSIREIEQEMQQGKTLWTYSCEPKTGAIVPGLITWAGVTHKSAKVMRITLDNGESFVCTPCHKFPQYGAEEKRAGDFVIGDSLIPLYRRKEPINNAGNNTYEQVFDNATKKWVYTHRVVADYLKDTVVGYRVHDPAVSNGKYEVRHHIDYNRYNNDPSNLCFMSSKDHIKYHQDHIKLMHAHNEYIREHEPEKYKEICEKISQGLVEYWENLSPEQREERNKLNDSWKDHTEEEYITRCTKISAGIQEYIDSLSPEEREIRAQRSRAAFKLGNIEFNRLMDTDPEFYNSVVSKRMQYWTPENREIRGMKTAERNKREWASSRGQERRRKHIENQSVVYSHSMLRAVIDLVHDKTSHQVTANDVVNELNNNIELLTELRELNQGKQIRNWSINDGFTASGLKTMVKQFGYESWSDFRTKESIHNHRIVNIEWLDDEIEVGTLTIDGDELFHNYHNFALSVGVLTSNSNLGEIDDLKFFTNKLFRGLRIPSSYLPTGADDSASQFNDGRVGTAYIQELRFNNYCMRLQSLMQEEFDEEFKLYLHTRGVNIDSSLFELKFQPPQNFASYRQAELDNQRINTYSSIAQQPYMSKRFAMKRFLGLSEEEIAENERLWAEENGESHPAVTDSSGELRSVGVSQAGMTADLASMADTTAPEGMMPSEGVPPVEGAATPPASPTSAA